ncbi:PRC-barrel domain-containing protein [Hyphococcus lacteus]|uniref:PRC-barrel domain-containing protein n=1 Tax=Hyphococcus lacteus TaxID=3143536 RepID=A0ABV3Z5X9_9PROT
MTDIIARDETASLISADKVEGTDVFNNDGEKLGSVQDVMLDKRQGNVAFAVMAFGGFLGMGEKHHPLPWDTLNYDDERDGYVVNLSKEKLEGAPTIERNETNRLYDRSYGEKIYGYYGVPPYWM